MEGEEKITDLNIVKNMFNGFALYKIVRDSFGKPIDYIFLEVNKEFEKQTGLKAKNILNKKLTQVLPKIKENPSEWVKKYGNVKAGGKSTQFEDYYESLGKWFKVNAYSPKKDYLVIIFENITERKKAEKEKEKAERYLDLAGTIIISLDLKGRISLLNKKGYEVLDYRKGELIGKNWFNACLPKKNIQEIKNVFKKIISGEIQGVETYENKIITNKGEEKDIVWHNTILKDNSGKTTGLLSSGEDITEQKKAEEKIKESQRMLQKIIDLIPTRIFWKDKNLNYLGCNFAFAKDAGKKHPRELIGKSDFEMSWKEQAKLYRKDDKKIIEGGEEKVNFEEPQTTPEGKKIWLLTTKIPLLDENKKIIGILGTYSDITDRKNTQEEILKKAQEFEKFNQFAVGRELKMIELKKEVNKLLANKGETKKYKIPENEK